MGYSDKSGIARFFTAYGQAILYFLVVFVYGIIGFAFIIGGGFMAGSSVINSILSGTFNFMNFISSLSGVMSIIGFILIMIGFLFLIMASFAAVIFVATRGPKFSRDVSFFGAFGASLKILLGFILFLAILIGLFVGALYIGVPIVTLIISIFVYVFGSLTPIAMMFRIIDYIVDKV